MVEKFFLTFDIFIKHFLVVPQKMRSLLNEDIGEKVLTQPPKVGPFYKLVFGLLLSLKKGDTYEPRKALYSGTNNQNITRG